MYGISTVRPSPKSPQKYRLDRTNVMLERSLTEWGKQQPEGLSGLLRQLLRAEYARREGLTAVAQAPGAPPPDAGEHAGPLPRPTPDD